MENKQYGYIRVSTKEQKTDRQLDAMLKQGLVPGCIFEDKQSGRDFNRPNYRRLVRRLRPGDVVFVLSIDRLGRNYREILEQWRFITREKKCHIVVLDMPLLDTRQKNDDLTGIFVAELVLQILSYVAETERKNIRRRQAEGIASAKARGVLFGRRAKPVPKEFNMIVSKWRNQEIQLKQALELLDMKRSLFYKKVKEMKL